MNINTGAPQETYRGLSGEQVARAQAMVAATVVRSTISAPRSILRAPKISGGMETVRSFDDLVNDTHTNELIDMVTNHGASIERDGMRIPNEADFMRRLSLDRVDMDAIGDYRGGSALLFNGYLRGTNKYLVNRRAFERFKGLFNGDSSKLPVTKGGEVVYRGMPDIRPGEPWEEKGFSSTTVSAMVADGFARSAQSRDGSARLVRMVMPPGVRYLPIGTGEQEVLFEPGLTMTPIGAGGNIPTSEGIASIDALVHRAVAPSQ